MKKGTKTKILDYLRQRGAVGPTEIAQKFSLSPQIIHRHLKSHLAAGTIEKIGKPPKVLYRIKSPISPTPTTELPPTTTKLIEETYTYISPQGALLEGMVGFYEWWSRVNRQEDFVRLAHEYVTQVTQLKKLQTAGGYIDATARMKQALGSITLDKVFYHDFYAIPKFGKTKLGTYVLHAKQSQNRRLIEVIANIIKPTLQDLMTTLKLDAFAFIPHSIRRKVPFLPTLLRSLQIALPEISLVKAYAGELIVPQKSLSKLGERIENARNTIFLPQTIFPYSSMLLIDDAVGSGASLNETAQKLKKAGVKKVFGFAIVGSYKGFEVIAEV